MRTLSFLLETQPAGMGAMLQILAIKSTDPIKDSKERGDAAGNSELFLRNLASAHSKLTRSFRIGQELFYRIGQGQRIVRHNQSPSNAIPHHFGYAGDRARDNWQA